MRSGFKAFCFIAGTALLGPALQAQDFAWSSSSPRSAGMGGAYVASSTDALDALAVNPAGLTLLRGHNLNLAVDTIFARGSFRNSVNQNAPLNDSPAAVPFGAVGMPVQHSRFSLGVGFMPEVLSEANWRYADAPGTAGATYGFRQQRAQIHALRTTAGVGFAVSPGIALGATLGAIYNSNVLQAPYIFQSQPALAGLKTLLDLHSNGWGWNAGLGILAHPIKSVELGLAWKSRTVIHSTGSAGGDAYAQFAALGVDAPSTFTYAAAVRSVLPQSLAANVGWQVNPRWLVAAQVNYVNWRDSFVTLPVVLTDGTNAVLNSLVGGTTVIDGVPLRWRNQFEFHGGVERNLTESTTIRAGYSHMNNPVPSSTLSPLTAAIYTDQITTGLTYRHGRSKYEAAYGFRPTATDAVQQSGLLAGEYNNSTVKIGAQSLTLMYSLTF